MAEQVKRILSIPLDGDDRLKPNTIAAAGHFSATRPRRELKEKVAGTRLVTNGGEAFFSQTPLFRNGAAGLEQAIRVWVPKPLIFGVTVSISKKEYLDSLELWPSSGESVGLLFVPEITEPTEFTIELRSHEETISNQLIVEPQRKWEIHLFHQTHFDIGYTEPQQIVLTEHLHYLDAALEIANQTEDWPEEAKFRWNLEVTYPLKRWLEMRPEADRKAMLDRIRSGQFEVNALPFSMHTEVYSMEELAWGLPFAQQLRDEEGIEIVSAVQSDVPGAVMGLSSLLTDAGIKYLSVAHNYAGRSATWDYDGQDLTRPFWWRAPSGKKLLVWHADTPHGVAYMEGNLVGIAEGAETTLAHLPDYLTALATQPYPYGKHAFGWHDLPSGVPVTRKPHGHHLLHLRVQESIADNAPPSIKVAQTVRDWNETWAWPKLRMSTNSDFFSRVEEELGDQFDVFSGDWTDWWVDGVGSGAHGVGLSRYAQTHLPVARTLHTLAEANDDQTDSKFADAWESMALFDEHTWGAADPWTDWQEERFSGVIQWRRKETFADRAYDGASQLLDRGLRLLSARVGSKVDTATLLVFNPSGQTRSDLVRVFVPEEHLPIIGTATVQDLVSGESVAARVEPQRNPQFRARGQWLTFLASDLPTVGYKLFAMTTDSQSTIAEQLEEQVLESNSYRVVIDPLSAAITSLLEKSNRRELVDSDSPFGFATAIYDTYATAPNFNHLSGRVQAHDLAFFGTRDVNQQGVVIRRRKDAVADEVVIRSSLTGTDFVETTISLPAGLPRVDISYRVVKPATDVKESLFFAFPFAIEDPDPEYEITGGVTSLDAPHVPGSARHMFAIRHWIGLGDEGGSIAWATKDAPLVELGAIALPYLPFPITTPEATNRRSTIFSWALNNIWDTNFPVRQGGEFFFSYSIGSYGELDRRTLGIATAERFSAPVAAISRPARPLNGDLPESDSFCSIDDPRIAITGLAVAEDGSSILVRLQSLADESVRSRVSFGDQRFSKVEQGSFLERELQQVVVVDGAVTVELASGSWTVLKLSR